MTKLSTEQRGAIVKQCSEKEKKAHISREFEISRSHVYRILDGGRHKAKTRKQFAVLTAQQMADLASLTQPDASGMVGDLAKDVGVSRATAWRFVHNVLKRVRKVGDQRFLNADPEAQRVFLQNANLLAPQLSYFVWGDEATVDHRCATDGKVWGAIGPPVKRMVASGRGQVCRIVCFSAANENVYIQAQSHTFDKPTFTRIVERVVAKMNPYPGPKSILVLDNASIHDPVEIAAACERHGVVYLPLPKYSPHLNPEEHLFHYIKAHARKARSARITDVLTWIGGFTLTHDVIHHCGYVGNC